MNDIDKLLQEAKLLLNRAANPSKFKNEAPINMPPLSYGLPPVYFANYPHPVGNTRDLHEIHIFNPSKLPVGIYPENSIVILHKHQPLLPCVPRLCHELGFTSENKEFQNTWRYLYPTVNIVPVRLDLSL